MSTPDPIACTFHLASPPPTGAAGIAIIALDGDVAGALERMRVPPVAIGHAALRRWHSVDDLVVARFGAEHALLFPHAGPAVLRHVMAALEAIGCEHRAPTDPRARYPEASDLLQARLLDALARAQSPLAIDLLLDQPERWARAALDPALVLADSESRLLRRLITPPLVVALGPPNIGKSSLLNALAGREVSIVADEPGTTRDHVGVHLNLGGLVVRYLDAPGLDADQEASEPILAEAQTLARQAARHADLVLLCADPATAFPQPPSAPSPPVLRVGLRDDRGRSPAGTEVSTSVREQRGLHDLAAAIRDRLVPLALRADPPNPPDSRAWVFWEDNAGPGCGPTAAAGA